MNQLAPYQRTIADRILSAMHNLNTRHIGIDMPTGSGVYHTIAAVLNSIQHHRNIDVLVIGRKELTDQLWQLVTGYVNLFTVGIQARPGYPSWGKLPAFWDIAIVLETDVHHDWWYANKAIVVRPRKLECLDYHLVLNESSPMGASITETTKLKG